MIFFSTQKFCQLCSEEIREGKDYFETWYPYHQIHCRPCHEMRKQKKEGVQ